MDLFSLLTCIECQTVFDSEDHLPLSLMCGHTVCKVCIQKLPFVCRVDGISETRELVEIPTSAIVMQILQSSTPGSCLCSVHHRVFEFFCKDCKEVMCARCIMSHYKHEYLEIENSAQEVQDLKDKFSVYYSNTVSNFHTVECECEQVKQALDKMKNKIEAGKQGLRSELRKKIRDLERSYKRKENEMKYKANPVLRYIEEKAEEGQKRMKLVTEQKEEAERKKEKLDKFTTNLPVLLRIKEFELQPLKLEKSDFDWTKLDIDLKVPVKVKLEESELSWEEERYRYLNRN